jgi:hypothetical protein
MVRPLKLDRDALALTTVRVSMKTKLLQDQKRIGFRQIFFNRHGVSTLSMQNLTPKDIYNAITADFKGAWKSIADNPDNNIGRGNFMFAHQAMTLLEFVARFY